MQLALTVADHVTQSLSDVLVELDEDAAGKVFRLIDALEDCDDVQNVYANYDVPDDVMEKIAADA